ncbi:M20 metallopeptidase family protein [Clostridium cylindrosporum]|uniref:Amidohydrolase n=1 Tax=Clostridium cylindrosporum DSM 605 TaxID=1121307 RepID=A0A0J8D6L6_CLOCY|nr:amidohydrolase [Clostridium cylindrosporum]KMT21725.1 amidohydrolase [Clostridium cylindrosporum DSM 605]
MKEYLDLSRKHFEKMKKIRRCLHSNPEIDRDLPYTCSLVKDELNSLDINYKTFENSGIIGQIGSRNDNIIALRADMDALEVVDLKNVDYKSQKNGIMHACGHDAHTAIQLGAAAILKELQEDLKGSVRLIFQPAEETDGGAKDMIEYGALEDVNAVIGLHVCEAMNTGNIGIKKGVVAAASNPFKIIVNGKGSHGASPANGIDAIVIACKVVENLQVLVSRETSATDSAVITVGKIKGGTAPNAVASKVEIEGIIRTLGNDLRQKTVRRVKEVAEFTAKMYGATVEVLIEEGYPSYDNDDNLFYFLSSSLNNSDEVKYVELNKPSMGVEDFAYYSQKVPSLYYRLGCRSEDKGIIHPAHGSYFDIDEECLIYGAAVQAMCAVELLKVNM